MWKMILRFLKIILIVAVILVITISIILLLLSMQPFVPNNYTQIVKTGGELEAKYLAMGPRRWNIWKCPPKKNGGISMSITPRS